MVRATIRIGGVSVLVSRRAQRSHGTTCRSAFLLLVPCAALRRVWVPKARRLAPFAHHAPIARLDSPLSLWCFVRKAPIFFATLKEEMNHARSCPVWPARCALRAARRPEDHETDGRDHSDVADLRVRVRPLALSRHQ